MQVVFDLPDGSQADQEVGLLGMIYEGDRLYRIAVVELLATGLEIEKAPAVVLREWLQRCDPLLFTLCCK